MNSKRKKFLQTIELVEIGVGEDKELFYQMDIVVLVKNKLMFQTGLYTELQLDCIAAYTPSKPMTLNLYYSFKTNSPELIKLNENFQIGNFYRIHGITDFFFEEENDFITIYGPKYKQIKYTMLPQKFIALLIHCLTEDDLRYEFMGGDFMQTQYKMTELFPWLNKKNMSIDTPEHKLEKVSQ